MFRDRIAMILKTVTLGVEAVDQETRRVVECTFEADPFTAAMADQLNVKSYLFDTTTKLPKADLDTIIVDIHEPVQKLSWGAAPDQEDKDRVVIPDVKILGKLRIKRKTDREPAMLSATLKVNFLYPTPDQLFYICNGVRDQHFLKFTPMAEELPLEDTEPAVAAPRRGRRTVGVGSGAAAAQTH